MGEPRGIYRFAHTAVPMDEALAEVAVDISGRPHLVYDAAIPKYKLGDFDSELVEEFFRAVAMNSKSTFHIILRRGNNVHHCIEAIFKAFARAISQALGINPAEQGIPSTKGIIET